MIERVFLVTAFLMTVAQGNHASLPESGKDPVTMREARQQPKQTDRTPAAPQGERNKIRRLILKDGSYEDIREYVIKGDRVRFLSSERSEWEEMPSSLVDWPATEKYAGEAESARQSRLSQLSAEEAKERAEAEASSPTVAPGLRLPDSGGVFLLDVFQGVQELNQLHQNGADVKKNAAGNILRGVINPVGGSKQTVELPGPHAVVQSHVQEPTIYINIDSGAESDTNPTQEGSKSQFSIVRCEEKKGNRTVGTVNIAVYGKTTGRTDSLEVKTESVAGNWVKVMPAAPLPAGEYALVEMLGEKSFNTYVWDFGVNPAAPVNADARRGAPPESAQPPVLLKRKKP